MRKRIDMIERRIGVIEGLGAVHAAPAAIAHSGALNRVLLVGEGKPPDPAGVGGRAGAQDAVIVPSGQIHLAKKTTPRDGKTSRHGALCRSAVAGGDYPAVAPKGDSLLLDDVGAELAWAFASAGPHFRQYFTP